MAWFIMLYENRFNWSSITQFLSFASKNEIISHFFYFCDWKHNNVMGINEKLLKILLLSFFHLRFLLQIYLWFKEMKRERIVFGEPWKCFWLIELKLFSYFLMRKKIAGICWRDFMEDFARFLSIWDKFL